MQHFRRVEIRKQTRLVDDFFKLDEVVASYQLPDGTMSRDERRLVLERGDSVAVLLHNVDTETVILANQFRVPTLLARRRENSATTDGWITETVAGMIDLPETPEHAAIRETREETGYQIKNPTLIAKFFSSPGSTSERIFLYFAAVRDADRCGDGGGGEENITVVQMPLAELFSLLETGSIEDPKLTIAAYWLKDHLKS